MQPDSDDLTVLLQGWMIVERFICQVCLYGALGTVPGQLCGQSVHGGFGFISTLPSTFEWECGAALAHTSSTSCARAARRCIVAYPRSE